MRTILVLSLLLFSRMAFSFETGEYFGESADHTEACGMELVQNASSVLLKSMYCRGFSWDHARELTFGHSEETYGGTHYFYEVSAEQVTTNGVSDNKDLVQHESITNGIGEIAYHVILSDRYNTREVNLILSKVSKNRVK